ncbi:hypothetical protein [Gracilimonas halophila]|uniref:Uncharacterized protein n=1 Tax=Gracilimonas halophila TaxID=1834464 RepID=A0ABW5JGQ9_9BACT
MDRETKLLIGGLVIAGIGFFIPLYSALFREGLDRFIYCFANRGDFHGAPVKS